ENGNHIFEAIPRDRDQAFSNFDGWVFRNFRKLIGFFHQFGDYDDDIANVEWFNRSASNLDRNLIENSGREEWISQAEFLQDAITDEVIEDAFRSLPEEVRGKSSEEIKSQLKARRENLVEIVSRYYEELSELAIMTGTDKDDIIEVTRLPGGNTQVQIFRKKDGEKGELMNERIFIEDETDEVWIYGLGDEDEFVVQGVNEADAEIRIIGGQDHDTYKIVQGKGVMIYDHRSQELTVEQNDGAKIYRTDNYEINTFNRDLKIWDKTSVLPYLGFNPDDGVILGAKAVITKNGLVRKPFTTQHSFKASYFFATQGFDLEYSGEFAQAQSSFNVLAGAYYSSARTTSNYFGFGNDTEYDRDAVSKDYNRIRISAYGAELGLVRRGEYGSSFRYS